MIGKEQRNEKDFQVMIRGGILALLILMTSAVFSQKKDKIKYKADGKMVVGKRDGKSYRKLSKNVIFTQKNTTIHCDSSFYFRKLNQMEAFGRVRILDDSTVITARELYYDGNTRKAKLRDNVVYTRGYRKLYTDSLDYDMDQEIAKYFENGKLVDTTNTLTSEIGYFYAQRDYALFWTNVVLVSPDFTLETDTLRYNTLTKIAYTQGPTKIINEDGTVLHADGGEFRTEVDQSEFVDGNVETEDYILEGDELFFDESNKYYKSLGNVILTAKEKDVIITGDEGYYDKKNGFSKVYGNPVMKRILEEDTLYMAADTLIAYDGEYDSTKRIAAFYDIRIFKSNLQGLADSAMYFVSDSLLYLYNDPILWNEKNQIVADTINMQIEDNTVRTMGLFQNSFLVSQDTLLHFNQIKGRNMTIFFEDNEINHTIVDGNGESIFYALGSGDSTLMGMNRILCSNMDLRFDDNQISNITFYKNPEGKFIPPHELKPDEQKLKGFEWREEERPILAEIFQKREERVDEEEDTDEEIGLDENSLQKLSKEAKKPVSTKKDPKEAAIDPRRKRQ